MGTHFYGIHLAEIHDTGFSFFAEGASIGILEILREKNIYSGHIVDLGCGSGILAKNMADNGYTITGVDLSPYMITLAKRKVPNVHFVTSSFYSIDIPPCKVVTATGECFNYIFEDSYAMSIIKDLFGRIYNSLTTRGLFIFDFAMPGRILSSKKNNWKQNNWEMEVEHHEDDHSKMLTRKIKLKVHTQNGVKEGQEIHQLQLFEKDELKSILIEVGFIPKFVNGFGSFIFPFEYGYGGFVAEK